MQFIAKTLKSLKIKKAKFNFFKVLKIVSEKRVRKNYVAQRLFSNERKQLHLFTPLNEETGIVYTHYKVQLQSNSVITNSRL